MFNNTRLQYQARKALARSEQKQVDKINKQFEVKWSDLHESLGTKKPRRIIPLPGSIQAMLYLFVIAIIILIK